MELLDVIDGSTIELDRVLMVADDDRITVGTPTVEGARVLATSQGDGKGKKTIVLKYKPKVRYRKKTGHRQPYTRLMIDRIIAPGISEEAPAKKTRSRKKEVKESGS